MFYKVNTTKLQIREGHGTNYQDIGDLFQGDVIEVAETMGGWHRIVSISHNGGPFFVPPNQLSSWCSAAYTVEIDNPNPDPEPEPEPEPNPEPTVKPLTIVITGEDWETLTVTLNPKA